MVFCFFENVGKKASDEDLFNEVGEEFFVKVSCDGFKFPSEKEGEEI